LFSIAGLRNGRELRCGSKFVESVTRHSGRLPSRKGASFPQFDARLKPSRRLPPTQRKSKPLKAAHTMRATDPGITFLLVLVIGIGAGFLFDRLAGPSWLARQFSGSSRGIITSVLVGVAGAFVGYHIALLLALGGEIVTTVIAAALGAAVVLFGWRMAK
jgi:uncharacterized membrane protein YeaQ/YmgE (transglycosylase-associated protein family)